MSRDPLKQRLRRRRDINRANAGAQAGVAEAVGRLAQANTASQQVAVSEAQAETAKANTEQSRPRAHRQPRTLLHKDYAPEDGRVTRKSVEQGALVQIGRHS